MLDLLHEAGAEAVTLDELGVAGVRDPARALLELELAGLEIQRVIVRGEHEGPAFECVRLAAPPVSEPRSDRPTVELAAVAPRVQPPQDSAPEPAADEPVAPVRGIILLALLLALVALLLRRR